MTAAASDLAPGPRRAPVTARLEPRLARVAAAIADPARSRMLSCLLGGHYASAGELARVASVTASTASGHLAKLLHAGLVDGETRGRHRYFRLADADVAHALEALALVAERGALDRQWDAPSRKPLRYARCCYDHLAGELGVALLDGLIRHRRLEAADGGYRLAPAGDAWLRSLGLDPIDARRARRFAYPCLDWSERRDHLAGALATSLLEHFVARRWLARAGADAPRRDALSHRALRVTTLGERELLPRLLD
jgi:DNA-binding transcriptional ArsR family regulator